MRQTASQRIGRHEVICLLGEGGMAQVYLGFVRGPANVNKLVVMKQIRSELARDKLFVTMFLDEARLATRLSHPNVVHTYDVLEDAGRYVLTMEYLEGQSLFDVLQSIDLQIFPLEEHLWILTQVLAGLQYAHALADYDGSPLGVVHRDVSPGNTFVTYNGDVKLLDFGIAKASGAVSVTVKGTFKGKLSYCAPEQVQGDVPVDARADIFAVGVMLWEALARRRIEVGEGYAALAQTRLTGREPRIRQVRPDVVPALADICDRAMALEPGDRYLTAVDFQRDLERYLESCGRRVGRAQVAELMRGHFEMERRQMQKRIETHLLMGRGGSTADKETLGSGDPLYEDLLQVGQRPSTASRATRWTLPQTDPSERLRPVVEPSTQEEGPPPPSPREPRSASLPEPVAVSVASSDVRFVRPRKALAARLLVVGAVLGGGVAATIGWWTDRAPPSAMSDASHTALSATVPATALETIRIDIRVTPSEAKLTVDENVVDGNLFREEVAKDRNLHTIQASAPGYVPFSQRVGFASDIKLDISLSPERRAAGSKAVGGRPQPRAGLKLTGNRPRAQRSEAPPEEGGDEKVETSPEPTLPVHTSEQIDEANPYAR